MLFVERHYLRKHSVYPSRSPLDVFTYVWQMPPLRRNSMALNVGGDRTSRQKEPGPLLEVFLSKRN